jgi:ATP-dependent Clp protease ATP-binding subunit ClpA
VFERFTERARQVVVLAQEQSLTLGHDHIGTEHILLGLLGEQEGLAGRVLVSLGLTQELVCAQVVRIVGSSEQAGGERAAGARARQVPFMPDAKRALELALREALGLGHDYIGTEHLLLGLVREDEGLAVRLLREFDVTPELVRGEIVRALSAAKPGVLRGSPSAHSPHGRDIDRSWLDFTPADASALLVRLAPMTSSIAFEVRRHAEQEPSFRVSCRLRGGDTDLRELVALEADGIRALLDRDGTVRLGHC